jgi:hypothetical protein
MPYDLLATFIRYALLALAGHLASRGYIGEDVADYAVSAGVALSAIVWFLATKKKPDEPRDPDYSAGQ